MPQLGDARAVGLLRDTRTADAFQFRDRSATRAGDLRTIQAFDLTAASGDHVVKDLCALGASQSHINILLKVLHHSVSS